MKENRQQAIVGKNHLKQKNGRTESNHRIRLSSPFNWPIVDDYIKATRPFMGISRRSRRSRRSFEKIIILERLFFVDLLAAVVWITFGLDNIRFE